MTKNKNPFITNVRLMRSSTDGVRFVVIPKPIVDLLKIKPGDSMEWDTYFGLINIVHRSKNTQEQAKEAQ